MSKFIQSGDLESVEAYHKNTEHLGHKPPIT